MRKHVKMFLACCLLASSAGAQDLWQWQNPLPQGNRLDDICFVDSLRGWATGSAGTVLRTTNGGKQWLTSRTPIHETLIRVSFINADRGWAITYFTYKLLRTTDGGATWDSISTLPSPSYHDLQFLNDSVGFAPGSNGKIMRTTDGGLTWNPTLSGYYGSVMAICFPNESVGWAAGSGGSAFRTTDGGNNWSQVYTAGFSPSTTQVFALDAEHAYIVGTYDFLGTIMGLLSCTTDGGTTWTEDFFERTLADVHFLSPDTGWVADTDGGISRTTNGGATWMPLNGRSNRFAFAGASRAWGINYSGEILATEDGWQTSYPQTRAVTTDFLWAVSAFDSNHVAACGGSSIVIGSKDGGKNWSAYYAPGSSTYLNDILHKSANDIWAVGEDGVVVHSTDGGSTWSDTTLAETWLSGIAFATEQTGFIAASRGALYKTSDAGKTWKTHASLGTSQLARIVFASPLLGWIAAGDGFYRSTDGGETWQQVYTSNVSALDVAAAGYCVWFPIVNRVVYSTNAGLTWSTSTVYPVTNIIYGIRSLAFTDESNGWATGDGGKIYRTTDGGNSWNIESDASGNSLHGIRFADANRGWAVGDAGGVLHYDGAVTSVPGVVVRGDPEGFALEQNYPNPFNPKTVVSGQLPVASWVRLTVFDMLGREIATLLNEQKEAGEFRVEFDGTALSSGVYVCRMTAGNYVSCKKMLLLQ